MPACGSCEHHGTFFQWLDHFVLLQRCRNSPDSLSERQQDLSRPEDSLSAGTPLGDRLGGLEKFLYLEVR